MWLTFINRTNRTSAECSMAGLWNFLTQMLEVQLGPGAGDVLITKNGLANNLSIDLIISNAHGPSFSTLSMGVLNQNLNRYIIQAALILSFIHSSSRRIEYDSFNHPFIRQLNLRFFLSSIHPFVESNIIISIIHSFINLILDSSFHPFIHSSNLI